MWSPQLSRGVWSGSIRSARAAVSFRKLAKLTTRPTFSRASANRRPPGQRVGGVAAVDHQDVDGAAAHLLDQLTPAGQVRGPPPHHVGTEAYGAAHVCGGVVEEIDGHMSGRCISAGELGARRQRHGGRCLGELPGDTLDALRRDAGGLGHPLGGERLHQRADRTGPRTGAPLADQHAGHGQSQEHRAMRLRRDPFVGVARR